MRVCEVCGAKEDAEDKERDKIESVILHVCDHCREDRKWSHFENWAF